MKDVNLSDKSFTNHGNKSHCCGLECLKASANVGEITVKTNCVPVKKRREIVACETEDMMHGQNRKKDIVAFHNEISIGNIGKKII